MSKQLSSLVVVLDASVKPFVSAFQGLKGVVGGFTSSIGTAGGAMLAFTGIGGAVAGVFGAIKGAARGISLAAELEQTNVAFETMLGSADAAKSMMASLTQFASSTPFEFPEIAAAAKQLLAFGVSAQDMTGKLTMLGDISAGIGKPIGDLAAIYGKVKSRGQLTGETLNQLAESGVPIYKALAAEMGTTTDQVAGLVTAGKIGFPQVDAALGKLTATGGQFSGMMAKQSKTLAGLWSTLTDNVGLAAAGLVTTVVDAFGLRDALAGFTSFVGSAGDTLNSFVQRAAPIVVGFASRVWSAIVGTASAIYGYVAPIVASLYDVIASRWQSIVSTTVAYASSLYNVATAVWRGISSLAVMVWNGIAAVWQWGCNLLGVETTGSSVTVAGAFDTMIAAFQWVQQQATTLFNVVAYAINNFGTLIDYIGSSVDYQLVRAYNVVEYYFTAALEYVKWFGTNLPTIILDSAQNALKTLNTFGVNVVSIVKNLPGLIAGTTDWSDVWTPLDDGFATHVSALPTIAERVPGEIENALASQSQGVGDGIVDGLIDSLNTADKRAAAATSGVTDAVGGTLKSVSDQFAAAKPPELKTPTVDTSGVNNATDAMDGLSKATDKAAKSWEALSYNSAEAMAAHASAAFTAGVQLTSGGAGSSSASTSSPLGAPPMSMVAMSPTASPVNAKTREAMASGTTAKDASSAVEMLAVARQLLAATLRIANDSTQLAEAV